MKIAVISPDRKQGNSTVSALLALALSETQQFSTCLTFTGNDSDSLAGMLGVNTAEDKTRSLTQLIKLLESNAISGNDIRDYCIPVPGLHNLNMMDTASESITEEDNARLFHFVMGHLNHQFVITDVATEIYDETTVSVIDQADLIVMVLTQSRENLQKLAYWKEANVLDYLSEKGLVYVFNQYDPYVEAFRDTTKRMGLKHNRCAKISYNPFIRRTSNMGKLPTILRFILENDPRVVELNNDLKECLMVILANLGLRTKWT